jgi:hypothetical protein
MRTLIAINYPNFPKRHVNGREYQGACSELAAAVRLMADKIQHCGVGSGDVVFERESGLTGTMRTELPDAKADAA